LQRFIQTCWVLATSLGKVRPTATTTTDDRSKLFHECTSFVLLGNIFAYRSKQGDPIFLDCPKDNNCRLQRVAQAVGHVTQALIINAFNPAGDHIDTVYLPGSAQQVIALGTSHLTLEFGQFFLQLTLLSQEPLDPISHFFVGAFENPANFLENVFFMANPV
jgi:hypothetical protein